MAKIKKVIINYPEDPKMMEKIQNKAMEIVANSLIKKYPPQVIKEFIAELENSN